MRTRLKGLGKWGLLAAWVGGLAGVASAVFLKALYAATDFRVAHPALLFGLPLAGALVALLYQRLGNGTEAGTKLLLARIQEPDEPVAFRMAPLILLSTVVTHLFGGSAGREGTALQLGGAVASASQRLFRLPPDDQSLLLLCGLSGGFGSVFGTPWAGTIFALEVTRTGRPRVEALLPCGIAAFVGDFVCRRLGIHHHVYASATPFPTLTLPLLLWVVLAGGIFGGVSRLFTEGLHGVQALVRRLPIFWLRPALGGLLVIGLTYATGTRDYLGLGLPLLTRSFSPGGVVLGAFALKLLFTVVTLGTGFKGGEVTPLFCIGATLGAAFATVTGQPTGFFAALGFVAVFAGAARAPLACAVLGLELFGVAYALPLALACSLSALVASKRSIYAQ
ncbi:chloride channel protein [Armatimonas rosea]|uniref:H+/Cl- antiporter ClcA n=1 Tax=Armatimonas rosea TaxID=685828 RepID=A0A7W9W924_ARMRO|nr:chloride channel protein [Armatimonas rosea]MBB6052846.1 H+/Cl- antiporter ClcA [Armatimonas rosea]